MHRYAKRVQIKDSVVLTPELRDMVGRAIVDKALEVPIPILALAVCAKHVHALVKLDPGSVGVNVGKLTRHSSHAIRAHLQGRVWSARKHEVAVTGMKHLVTCVRYIERHRDEGAFVWVDERVR